MHKLFSIRIYLLYPALLLAIMGQAKTSWELKKTQDGIKVYTGAQPDSKVKAVKVECLLNATFSQVAAVIMDISTNHLWVYHTKNCSIVKQTSPFDLYYYAEVETPWPVSNRDFIAHLKLSQNPVTKVMVVEAENAPYFLPQKENIVRIMVSTGKWIVSLQPGGMLKAEYTLFTDPGGNVPAWLVNMFIAEGPMESFQKLKEHIKKPAYANARFPGIINN